MSKVRRPGDDVFGASSLEAQWRAFRSKDPDLPKTIDEAQALLNQWRSTILGGLHEKQSTVWGEFAEDTLIAEFHKAGIFLPDERVARRMFSV